MANVEDDKIIAALRQTLQHISLQQSKFKGIEEQLRDAKDELVQERERRTSLVTEFESQLGDVRKDLNHFRSLSQEQSATISELQIECQQHSQKSNQLHQQLKARQASEAVFQAEAERNSLELIHKLEDEKRILQSKIDTLSIEIEVQRPELKQLHSENERLQQTVSELKEQIHERHADIGRWSELKAENDKLRETIAQSEAKEAQSLAHSHSMEGELQVLRNDHDLLQRQCAALKRMEQSHELKTQEHWAQSAKMGQSALNLLDGCRNLRESVISTKMDIAEHQLQHKMLVREMSIKMASVPFGERRSTKAKPLSTEFVQAIKLNLERIGETKSCLQTLRGDVERDLSSFDHDIRSIQRGLYRQKSLIQRDLRKGQETAKAEMENAQNSEQRLQEYLRQKEELQQKIGELEGFLKDKKEGDIVSEMKRFRSAAIITTVSSLTDGSESKLAYHELNQYEKKAIALKSKFERQLDSKTTIHEKVDEFVRSGGLKRYPIMEQEFEYEPTETDKRRFRFGTKYISISYHVKRDELFVKAPDGGSQRLQEWISKNSASEMRKLLAKVSRNRKLSKSLIS